MKRAEIEHAIFVARTIAEPIGPLHGYWDTITEAEQLLLGQPTLLKQSVVEELLQNILDRHPEIQ